jgi:hypothetical protein
MKGVGDKRHRYVVGFRHDPWLATESSDINSAALRPAACETCSASISLFVSRWRKQRFAGRLPLGSQVIIDALACGMI